MHLHEPITDAWSAKLALDFERRPTGTILTRREHMGPLRVQKALYPEGPQTCHVIVLHPPSGIVGGDELDIAMRCGTEAHALLTTPGAGKWYRSAGAWASQTLRFELAANSVLEWLPQETILFNAAKSAMRTEINLHEGACFIGQEVLCLGRRAMNETFDQGEVRLATDIRLNDTPLWHERGLIDGGANIMHAQTGLAGMSVTATLLIAGRNVPAELLAACREHLPDEAIARFGISAMPNVCVARYLGHSAESARAWIARLWATIRPELIGLPAQTPRIWNT